MARVTVLIDDFFEEIENSKPDAAFKKAGHELVYLGLKKDTVVKGKKQGIKVRVEKSVRDVSVDQFDALLIPGGYSPDRLRSDDKAVPLVRDFVESGKPLFSICHAPQITITAQARKVEKLPVGSRSFRISKMPGQN